MFNGMNGLEILKNWPRYESGELVGFGDDVSRHGEDFEANVIALYRDGSFSLNFWAYSKGERVRRPAVLAADGEPLVAGQMVYHIESGDEFTVTGVDAKSGDANLRWGHDFESKTGSCASELLTHQRPVLDVDGVPINVGDTVWHIETGREYVVVEPSYGETVVVRLAKYDDAEGEQYTPDRLTHRAPVLAADGEPLEVGQTVFDTDAEDGTHLTVVEVSSDLIRCEYTWKDGKTYRPCYPPSVLTHTKPVDTWERIEEDIAEGFMATEETTRDLREEARDIVRRCRKLAERERGE